MLKEKYYVLSGEPKGASAPFFLFNIPYYLASEVENSLAKFSDK
jgi:hypothetical protein